MNYDWDFSVLIQPITVKALLNGFRTTVLLTFWSIVFGTPLGILFGSLACAGAESRSLFANVTSATNKRKVFSGAVRLVRWLMIGYIDVIRAIPLLLLILICFYGLPELLNMPIVAGIGHRFGVHQLPVLTPFQCCVVAFIINLSAFVADVVRGSVAGTPKGSVMAAQSLGMNHRLIWRRIILPDVIREIFPSLTLLWITIFKMSTLASTVTVYEVLHSADFIIQKTYKPLELYLAVCIFFLAAIIPLSAVARRLEKTQMLRRRSL